MIERLLPRTADNHYRGHPLALWLFIPITLVTLARSLIHILRFDGGAQSIATIPLDQYSGEAAQTIVSIFGMWGLSQLLLGAVFALVLFRYRSLLPLMYLLFVAEWSGRLLIGLWKPVATVGQAPGAVGNLILPWIGVGLLILSMRGRTREVEGDSAKR